MKSASKMAMNSPCDGFEAVFQRAGFVAFAIGAMDVDDGHALRGVALDAGAGDFARFVGGIVEDLNVEQFARIVEARDGFDEALDHVALVEDGKLDGDARPIGDSRRRSRNIFASKRSSRRPASSGAGRRPRG